MPSWLSPLLAQGAVAAIFLVALVVSIVEPHVHDLVWRRLAGSVVAAATRRSREEHQQALAAAERDERIRSAMATIRAGLITWSTHTGVAKTSLAVATTMADIHRGIAELRTEEPRAMAELDVIMGATSSPNSHVTLQMAQPMLAALETKLRELNKKTPAK